MYTEKKMRTETKTQAGRCSHRKESGAPRRSHLARLLALMQKRREGLFAPLAAFASLAGTAGLPFIPL